MPEPQKNLIRAFTTSAAFSQWLEKNHAVKTELWVKIYKKNAKKKSISWDDVVLECLSWGWIDGIKKSYDDDSYLQRVTPRKPKSSWSQRNCQNVEQLIKDNRMQEPGLLQVQAAKTDGRWENAYAPQSALHMPEDFVAAVNLDKKAKDSFDTLTRAQKFSIMYKLQMSKKPETREKWFQRYLDTLRRGEKIT